MKVPNPTSIFHITHLNNLKSILNKKGLSCVTNLSLTQSSYTNIAHADIQSRRSSFQVPIDPYGNLHDYVPFYFAPRSPMLYTINRGNVVGYKEGQGPVIYLVSDAQTVHKKSIAYCFTDGHGIMHFTEYYKGLKDLDKIDWEIMNSRYWFDTTDDNDRRRRRQAEFLVHNFLPLECINAICVINDKVKENVDQLLESFNLQIPVLVKRNWYY